MNFKPKDLPEIDLVQVVNLCNIDANNVSEYMNEAKFATFVEVSGELSQQIADLWRKLPKDGQMRCHNPPFGLRFYKDGVLILQASICWECNNIFGDEKGERIHYEFNGEHKISQELLSICKSTDGQ